MRKIISFVLILICIASFAVLADGRFTDVKKTDWFYADVENAVSLGLINGKANNTYCPNDNLTYAEAVKLAACMHERYMTGKVTLENGNPWYSPYLEYCFEWNILDSSFYSKVARPTDFATRAGYMEIFARALPDEALETVNFVPNGKIPDISMDAEYASSVYKLYRAGIVAGSDAAHNCKPDSNIKRSEVAAILSRMMDKSKRVKFNIGDPSSVKPISSFLRTEKTGNRIVASVITEGGIAPYTYRWQGILDDKMGNAWSFLDEMLSNVDIPELYGANDGTIIYNAPENAGCVRFRCVVYDSLGFSYVTEEAEFNVEPPALKIKDQPQKYSGASDGDILKYSVVAEGGKAPYKYTWVYRWRYNQTVEITNGAYVSGANTNTLSLKFSLDNPLNDKSFYCIVTDALGNTVSSNQSKLPEGVLVMSVESFDSNKTFMVATVKSGTLRVGDYLVVYIPKESLFCGGTVKKIEMFGKSLDEADANDRVGVTLDNYNFNIDLEAFESSYGDKLSSEIWNKAPFATRLSLYSRLKGNPVGDEGYTAQFEVVAVGGKPPYTYQWQISNRYSDGFYNITKFTGGGTGYNTPSLIHTICESDFLTFAEYRCVVTDSEGTVHVSDTARIIPLTRSYVYSYPKSVIANYGDTAQLSVGVIKGDGMRLEYQWQIKTDNHKDFSDIVSVDSWAKGAQTDTLLIEVDKSTFVGHAQFRCKIKSIDNLTGKEYTEITTAARITPDTPIIIMQPKNAYVEDGTKLSINFWVEGQIADYQWQLADESVNDGNFVNFTDSCTWATGWWTKEITLDVDGDVLDGCKLRCVVTGKNGKKVVTNEVEIIVSQDASVDLVEGGTKKEPPVIVLLP